MIFMCFVVFFKQKTAYELRISDWSSDVCSSDLRKGDIPSVPPLAMALTEYLLFVDVNPRKALDVAAESTVVVQYKDWWWKARLGRCYFKLGMQIGRA